MAMIPKVVILIINVVVFCGCNFTQKNEKRFSTADSHDHFTDIESKPITILVNTIDGKEWAIDRHPGLDLVVIRNGTAMNQDTLFAKGLDSVYCIDFYLVISISCRGGSGTGYGNTFLFFENNSRISKALAFPSKEIVKLGFFFKPEKNAFYADIQYSAHFNDDFRIVEVYIAKENDGTQDMPIQENWEEISSPMLWDYEQNKFILDSIFIENAQLPDNRIETINNYLPCLKLKRNLVVYYNNNFFGYNDASSSLIPLHVCN